MTKKRLSGKEQRRRANQSNKQQRANMKPEDRTMAEFMDRVRFNARMDAIYGPRPRPYPWEQGPYLYRNSTAGL